MIISLFIIALAFIYLLIETDFLRIRLLAHDTGKSNTINPDNYKPHLYMEDIYPKIIIHPKEQEENNEK